jgi:hypothetical protein
VIEQTAHPRRHSWLFVSRQDASVPVAVMAR